MRRFRTALGGCVACLVAGAWNSACSDDPVGVRLVVTATVAVPDDVDQLRITVVGSRGEGEHPLCQPWQEEFDLASDADLPFELGIEKGTEFAAWIAFRVEALKEGAAVMRSERHVPWPAEGVLDVPVLLDERCLHLPLGASCSDPLDPAEWCLEGLCVDVWSRGLFEDDNPDVDAGAPPCVRPWW